MSMPLDAADTALCRHAVFLKQSPFPISPAILASSAGKWQCHPAISPSRYPAIPPEKTKRAG
jgi:hypothetical protein